MSSTLGIWATLNTTYRCNSPVSFNVGGVTVTFRNTRLEAYMPGNDLSDTGTARSCARLLAFPCDCHYCIHNRVSSQRASARRTRPRPQRHPPPSLPPPPPPQRPLPLRHRPPREHLNAACTPSSRATAPSASWLRWVCSSMCPIFHGLRIR